jgi:putative DNA primase/helicase
MEDEVHSIAESASNKVPASYPSSGGKLTQVTMSETIAKNYAGRLCCIKGSDTWKIFNEQTRLWEANDSEHIKGIVREGLDRMKRALEASVRETQVRNEQAWRDIERNENDTFFSGTTRVLCTEKGMRRSISTFDASPMLVGLQGGQCLDLKTNTVREIVSTDFLTKTLAAAYDPNAQCPIWEQRLLEWSDGDQTQVDFLQQWAGYCLSVSDP